VPRRLGSVPRNGLQGIAMAATSDIFAEGFKQSPYWWEAARPETRLASPLPEATDVAIVGSGYTGLSAALELQRNGVAATVIEADALGHGASTRNGGHVSGGVNVAKGASAVDKALVERMLAEASEAYDHLAGLIEREKIDCYFQQVGRFTGAHCPGAYEDLARRVDALNRFADSGVDLVPRARQHEEIASDYYYGGITVKKGAALHPALLHKGLLEAAHKAGATLCAETRVGRIERQDGGFLVHTSKGQVRAREVIVATNGYTGEATPWHRRRVVPVASYIIATEEIGKERVRGLFPTLRVIGDTKRVLYYYRPSPDRTRVVFGGRASFAARSALETAPKLHGFMLGVFPQLEGVKITHAWNGFVAFTFDRVPHMGATDAEPGLHYCLGCNGSGVVMMTHLGHRTALKILGRTNRPSAFEELSMPGMPLYDGNPWFLPLVGEYYRLRDWIDRKLAA
jgi:glycine/D-amino acid oxidase-like deaminating enzyme